MSVFSKEGAANNNSSDRLNLVTKNQHERPPSSSRRSRSKRKGTNSNEKMNVEKKKKPPMIGKSADSFGREDDEAEKQRKRMQGVGMFTGEDFDQHEPVMITDYLSNVRDRYHVSHKELGHGHYGVVRKCMDRKTEEWFAIKSIRKSKINKLEVLRREIDILKDVSHPNIIRLREVHEDSQYLHLITELCSGGELFDRIIAKTQSAEGHFSERDAAKLIRSILDAIAYCHDEKKIVHRDLKPENFLFATTDDDAPIKIIDFGLSRPDVGPGSIMKTKVGTPYYVAPEVLKRKYTASCDIWSIGVITYILLCGYPPFYGDSDTQIFDSVRAGNFDFPSPEWDTISDSAKDFICCLLKKEPTERLTAANAMQHKWIKQFTVGRRTSMNIRYDIRGGRRRSQQFTAFMGMTKLKKAALGYIAANLTQEEMQKLGEIVQELDKDNVGNITLKQLDDALKEDNFVPELSERLQTLREELSLSGEEMLKWKDFHDAMLDKSVLMKEDKIFLACEQFKKAENNTLESTHLIELLGGENIAKGILDLGTITGEHISYEEFRRMVTRRFTGVLDSLHDIEDPDENIEDSGENEIMDTT